VSIISIETQTYLAFPSSRACLIFEHWTLSFSKIYKI